MSETATLSLPSAAKAKTGDAWKTLALLLVGLIVGVYIGIHAKYVPLNASPASATTAVTVPAAATGK